MEAYYTGMWDNSGNVIYTGTVRGRILHKVKVTLLVNI